MSNVYNHKLSYIISPCHNLTLLSSFLYIDYQVTTITRMTSKCFQLTHIKYLLGASWSKEYALTYPHVSMHANLTYSRIMTTPRAGGMRILPHDVRLRLVGSTLHTVYVHVHVHVTRTRTRTRTRPVYTRINSNYVHKINYAMSDHVIHWRQLIYDNMIVVAGKFLALILL